MEATSAKEDERSPRPAALPPVRLGLIGASRVSGRIIKAAESVRNLAISAVGSRSPERAAAIARGIPGAQTETYHDVLQRRDIEAVYISLPNALHFEFAMKAVRARKHVLIEKPAVLELTQLAKLQSEAAQAGVVVMEAMWYRYHSQITALRDLIGAGVLGPIRSVAASACYHNPDPTDIRWNANLGGGAITDLFCYHADLLTHILGVRPEDLAHVEAFARHRNEVAASAHAELKTGAGATFNLTVSIERDSPNQTVIVGEKGSCIIPDLRAFPEINPVSFTVTGGESGLKLFPQEDAYRNMLAAFVDGIRGKREGLMTLEDTEANLKIMRKIETACSLELADRTALLPKLSSKSARVWRKLVGTPRSWVSRLP